MAGLDEYFNGERMDHPLLRYLQQRQGVKKVEFELHRPRAALGFGPARIYLHLIGENKSDIDLRDEPWDEQLNNALIAQGIKAVDLDNETSRFALTLRAAFREAENRYGDGYFNSVLIRHLKQSPFGEIPEIAEVLRQVHENDPSPDSYEECKEAIEGAIRMRAQELTERLQYRRVEAELILSGAIAQYVDERFSVSNRRRLGWLTAR